MTDEVPYISILDTIEDISTRFGFCRNRVWEIARSLGENERILFMQILDSAGLSPGDQVGCHDDHDECTFDFCEHSRLDFTSVAQRHEQCDGNCKRRFFYDQMLVIAVENRQSTAWSFNIRSGFPYLLERPAPFMAVSHVWSDGTGQGEPGRANACLYDYFENIAEGFYCQGIWWDTISIPQGKAARSKAIVEIQRNYEEAQITLVHDCFLRQWEWISPEVACFAIVISPWFSRGWTALELASSRKVKVVFKDVIKDLDEDILAKVSLAPDEEKDKNNVGIPGRVSPRHAVASGVVSALRKRTFANIDELLRILGPRHTSWPRDMAIIAAQLVGVKVNPRASQQEIYQAVLKKVGTISHENLFHNSVTMSKGFSWCPTSLFSLRQSSSTTQAPSLSVKTGGHLLGRWEVFDVLDDMGRYNWKHMHPLVEARLRESLKHADKHLILVRPRGDSTSGIVSEALLVKRLHHTNLRVVQFVGPVYFHPPIRIEELRILPNADRKGEEITIAGKHPTRMETERPGSEEEVVSAVLENAEPGLGMRAGEMRLQGAENILMDDDGNSALHIAARSGHSSDVENILKSGDDPDYRNEEGMTALCLAARNGHSAVVKLVGAIEITSCNPNLVDNYGWTALHHAVWNCRTNVVRELLNNEVLDLSIRDSLGHDVLHLAARRGHVTIARSLLDKCPALLQAKCNDESLGALHHAVCGGSYNMVKLLLDSSGADVESYINSTGDIVVERTPLHIAVTLSRTTLIELLLSHGARADIKDRYGQIPLHLAARSGDASVAARLLQVTAAQLDLEDDKGQTPLSVAAKFGHKDVVKVLVRAGADFNYTGGSLKSPLVVATELGNADVIEALISEGADPNFTDRDGRTLLLAAAENGRAVVVKLLLKNGASAGLEVKGKGGRTPLFGAMSKTSEETVKILLDHGANPETRDDKNEPLLIAAAKSGDVSIVELIIRHEANMESNDSAGRTALSYAAINKDPTMIKLLANRGANVAWEDKRGLSALDLFMEPVRKSSRNDYKSLRDDPRVFEALTGSRVTELTIERQSKLVHWAIVKGHASTMRWLLDCGIELEMKDEHGATPLSVASKLGHDDVVSVLIDKGAQINMTDNQGRTPLSLAFMAEPHLVSEPTIELLLERGAEPDSRTHGGEILLWALKRKNIKVAKLLIVKGVDMNPPKGSDEKSPLKIAAGFGNTDLVQLMIDNGAKDVDDGEENSKALAAAYDARSWEVVEILLRHGALTTNSRIGGLLLLTACVNSLEGLVSLLLQKGAPLEYKYPLDGRDTPLLLAARQDSVKVVEELLTNGAKVEAKDEAGQTPLFHAVKNVHITKLLLKYGADPRVKDADGRTILSRAVARGYTETVEVLSNHLGREKPRYPQRSSEQRRAVIKANFPRENEELTKHSCE